MEEETEVRKNIFQRKTWANKLRLKNKLYSMKLCRRNDLQEHTKQFVEPFEELAGIGDNFEEEDKVICLLASLPEDFSTQKTFHWRLRR